jgi:hypothetical protein
MNITAMAMAAALVAGPALGADNEAGVPLRPAEAAGAWSLETNGRPLCVLDLGRGRAAGGFAVRTRGGCGDAFPAAPARWSPTADGMRLVAADGSTVMGFHRWSNSLFVAHTPNGDLQLRRGQ